MKPIPSVGLAAWGMAAAVLALGSCGPADQPMVAERAGAAEVRLALLPPSREGDAAVKTGTLEREGPCLYLVSADGSRTIPAFITFDTRWDGDLAVEGRRFRLGDKVRLGGGEINSKTANLAWVQKPDPSCSAPTYWITLSIDPA